MAGVTVAVEANDVTDIEANGRTVRVEVEDTDDVEGAGDAMRVGDSDRTEVGVPGTGGGGLAATTASARRALSDLRSC